MAGTGGGPSGSPPLPGRGSTQRKGDGFSLGGGASFCFGAGGVRGGSGCAPGAMAPPRGLNRDDGINWVPFSRPAPSWRGRLVWLGVTVSAGRAPGRDAWGRVWSRSRAESTAPYTAVNTACSRWNFTSVLVGWTFTSTSPGFTVRWITQPGNLPTSFWFL